MTYLGESRLALNFVSDIRGNLLLLSNRWLRAVRGLILSPVDGSEGGTGAAPVEFAMHLGSPLRDAVVFVDNCLRGAGLRDRVKVAASGKIVSAYDIIRLCALGADWCNMARPFMFSIGCIQARDCASSNCPSGVATMNPGRYRVIDVNDRARRVLNFHGIR